LRCPYCGEEFEAERPGDSRRHGREIPRRDQEAHRGPLIANLGQVSLVIGGLSPCMIGLGGLVSIPVGLIALIWANHDLARMRSGQMDPLGKAQTELGRTYAGAGILMSLVFGIGFILAFWVERLVLW